MNEQNEKEKQYEEYLAKKKMIEDLKKQREIEMERVGQAHQDAEA